MNTLRHSVWAVLGIALLSAGCPQAPNPDPIEPGPRIVSFTASKTLVKSGETVTLSWKTENATAVKLEDARKGELPAATELEGSVDVLVNADSLFVFSAVNARGSAERKALSVRVEASARDLLLYVLPAEVTAGESATLTWSAPEGQQVAITASPGGALNLNGQTTQGALTVTPAATTTYTLTADGKSTTAKVTVKPKISAFSATPTAAPRGGTVAIGWETAGATELTLTAAGRGILHTETDAAKVAQGSFTETIPAAVDPGTVYSYVLTVKDAAGATSQQTLAVYVQGVPVVKTFTGPALARQGQNLTLSWTTEQAAQVTISAGGAAFFQTADAAKVNAGSVTIPVPMAKTTYQVAASGHHGGTATKTLEVDSVGAPSISQLVATPSTVAAGSPVTLSWTAANARGLKIVEAADGVVHADRGSQASTITLYPSHSSTFTLTVDNSLGETATATAAVSVSSPAGLTPSVTGTLVSGTALQLDWNVSSATQLYGLPHGQVTARSTSSFDDISTTGQALSFLREQDDDYATLPVSFPVTLMGAGVGDQVQIGTNGALVFGPRMNGDNFDPTALPSPRLEPYAVAPYWTDLTVDQSAAGSGVYWQVKTVNGLQTLIVQWNKMKEYGAAQTGITFQARIQQTGQVDFDYVKLPTSGAPAFTGVQGRPDWGVSGTAVEGGGLTFFGPLSKPAAFAPVVPGTVSGWLQITGGWMRVSHRFDSVMRPGDLVVSEVMAKPDPSLVGGEWFELTNRTWMAADLSSFSAVISDGGTFALSGTVPPFGSLVFGQTNDPAQNGDAGVDVPLAGLDLGEADSVSLVRGTALAAGSWSLAFDAGTARSFDPGPYLYRGDAGASANLGCDSTVAFSNAPPQLGTPGRQTSCGFGYVLQSIPGSYYEIADAGTRVFNRAINADTETVTLPTSIPSPVYFGVGQPTVSFNSNGWLMFGTTTTTTGSNRSFPNSSSPLGTVAIYWDDLYAPGTDGRDVYWKRMAANEDPKNPAPHWIFEWKGFTWPTSQDSLNFQAKFFDDGVIEYHYGDMYGTDYAHLANGQGATVWLENPTGTQALPININQGLIAPHSGYRFTPR